MRTNAKRAIVLLVLAAACLAGGDFQSIFNGVDFTGWAVLCGADDESKTGWFSVKDGALEISTGSDHGYMWLLYEAREYADFHFKCRFQAFTDVKGNSGIQFRSRYENGWMSGPQADIHPKAPWRTASIYDETRADRGWLAGGDKSDPLPDGFVFHFASDSPSWNDMEIIATGTHVTTMLNGLVIRDVDLPILDNQNHRDMNVGMKGYFAFQAHSSQAVKIRLKDVFVKELGSTQTMRPAGYRPVRAQTPHGSGNVYDIRGARVSATVNGVHVTQSYRGIFVSTNNKHGL